MRSGISTGTFRTALLVAAALAHKGWATGVVSSGGMS